MTFNKKPKQHSLFVYKNQHSNFPAIKKKHQMISKNQSWNSTFASKVGSWEVFDPLDLVGCGCWYWCGSDSWGALTAKTVQGIEKKRGQTGNFPRTAHQEHMGILPFLLNKNICTLYIKVSTFSMGFFYMGLWNIFYCTVVNNAWGFMVHGIFSTLYHPADDGCCVVNPFCAASVSSWI